MNALLWREGPGAQKEVTARRRAQVRPGFFPENMGHDERNLGIRPKPCFSSL
jgi:hypothetical protein